MKTLGLGHRFNVKGFKSSSGVMSTPPFFRSPRAEATVRLPMENLPGFSLVSDFSAGHGFGKFGSAPGTYTDDTTQGYRNGRSFKITTDGTATATDARKTTTSFDATNKVLFIVVKFDDVSKITAFDVTIGDSTLANRWRFQTLQGSQGNLWLHSNEWQLLTIPWQAGSVTGTPNRAAITTYQIRAISSGKGVLTMNVGAIGWMNKPASIATISADDGYASCYTSLYPKITANNLCATFFVIPSELSPTIGNRLTKAQLQEMYASGRIEYGYHAAGNDQRALTTSQLRQDIETTLKFWKGMGIRIKCAAYPGGEEDENVSGDKVRDIYAQYFGASRMIFQGQNEIIPPADSLRLRASPYVTNVTTTATVGTDLTNCVNNGGWHIETYHELVASGASATTQYLIADFNTNMDAVKNSGIQCKTISQALGL